MRSIGRARPVFFACISGFLASLVIFFLPLASAFPSFERSSAKAPCQQVNESSSPIKPLIIIKVPTGTPSPQPAPELFGLRAALTRWSKIIFNGLLRAHLMRKFRH